MERIDKKVLVIMAFLLILAGSAVAAYLSKPLDLSRPTAIKTEKAAPENQRYDIPESRGYSLGPDGAKITIVEFSDFACPYCREEYPIVRQLAAKYKGSVKIIYRDYPLHENSVALALAARCAGEQGFFWPMHDKLFAAQGSFSAADLPGMAASVGADKAKFSACYDAQKYLTDIQKDLSDAEYLKLKGTPTFFINGYKFEGAIPLENFEEILKEF